MAHMFRRINAFGTIDLPALEKHVAYLVRAGVRPLLAGTNGEGIHLAHGERTRLIHSTRKALDTAGFLEVPIIVGAGGGSTRETIALCEEVGAAGADAAIVITPGYFAGILANHRSALKEYFTEVASKSPVPVLIYNCGALVNPPEAIYSLMNARAHRSRCQCRNRPRL
jgi:L-threo-3-deoxy-hexylosonate aldolase